MPRSKPRLNTRHSWERFQLHTLLQSAPKERILNPIARTLAIAFLLLVPIGALASKRPDLSNGRAHSQAVEKSTTNSAHTSLTPAFTLSAPTPNKLALVRGQAGMMTVTLAANATFNGPVHLTCSGGSAELQCLISPPSVMLTAGQKSPATVAVASQGTSSTEACNRSPAWLKYPQGIAISGIFVFLSLIPYRRCRWPTIFSALLLIALGISASICVSGCHAGNNRQPMGTALGITTLTITATSATTVQTQRVDINVSSQ